MTSLGRAKVNEHSIVHHVGWMVCQCRKHFSIVFHYEKSHPSKPHYLATKTPKITHMQLLYNYPLVLQLLCNYIFLYKYGVLINKLSH